MDGAHTIERCEEVTAATLDEVFAQLRAHRVDLTGIVLKPNMVIAGKKCPKHAGVADVATATVRCLRGHVPAIVPGIAFLSGGQSSAEATAHLSAMNQLGPHPWQLSFSYGRALQDEALKAWAGKDSQFKAGQSAFQRRARLNGLARSGSYRPEMEAA
jgi:fructose-bisphosphate aldolase class I